MGSEIRGGGFFWIHGKTARTGLNDFFSSSFRCRGQGIANWFDPCSSPKLASPEGSASQLDNLAAKVQGLETELAEVRREVTQINSRLDALF